MKRLPPAAGKAPQSRKRALAWIIPSTVFIALAVSVLLPGCFGMQNIQKDVDAFIAVGGQYLLHKNPRAGDYAHYRVTGSLSYPQSGKTFLYEKDRYLSILKIENGEIFIREDEQVLKALDADTGEQLPRNQAHWISLMPRRIVTDMDGVIKRVYMLKNYQFGPMPVAQAGDMGYVTWSVIDKQVPVKLSTGKTVATRPLWYLKKSTLTIAASFVSINSQMNYYEISYVDDGLKFLTALNQTMVLGDMSTKTSWSKLALTMVQSMTFTGFFSSPATLSWDFVKKGFVNFARSAAAPSEKKALETVLKNLEIETEQKSSLIKGSSTYYLVKDGNLENRRPLPAFFYGNDPEPTGFR